MVGEGCSRGYELTLIKSLLIITNTLVQFLLSSLFDGTVGNFKDAFAQKAYHLII